jgi:hypothetical protein
MSYEGYSQVICANGHSYDIDCNDFGHDGRCPECQAESVWTNGVDTTNGSFNIDSDGNETNERIDGYVELEVLALPSFCTCKDCGNQHQMKSTTYKIPETRGHKGKLVRGYGGVDLE